MVVSENSYSVASRKIEELVYSYIQSRLTLVEHCKHVLKIAYVTMDTQSKILPASLYEPLVLRYFRYVGSITICLICIHFQYLRRYVLLYFFTVV